MSAHWSTRYLGLPWKLGERDCWSFFREVQRDVYGRDVPVIDIDAASPKEVVRTIDRHAERARWKPVDRPGDGDGVLLGRSRHPFHVGVWTAPGMVVHCAEGVGVIVQDLASLRVHGWSNIRFYTPCT